MGNHFSTWTDSREQAKNQEQITQVAFISHRMTTLSLPNALPLNRERATIVPPNQPDAPAPLVGCSRLLDSVATSTLKPMPAIAEPPPTNHPRNANSYGQRQPQRELQAAVRRVHFQLGLSRIGRAFHDDECRVLCLSDGVEQDSKILLGALFVT